MKLSNVVVMCLSALLGLLMVCFTVIACTMVVNWSAPDEAAILEGKVCSVQVFSSDYEVQPLADDSAPVFADMDANADFDLVIDGTPDTSTAVGVWFFSVPSFSDVDYGGQFPVGFSTWSTLSFEGSSVYSAFSLSFYSTSDFVVGGVRSASFDISDTFFEFDGDSFNWVSVGNRLIYVYSDLYNISSRLISWGAYKVSDSLDYEPVVVSEKGSYIAPFLDVFDGLGVWLIAGLNNVIALFWVADAGTLTLLGILAVAALAVSVFLLLMSIIQNFLHFRG